jgi:hypothetical protein
MPTPILTREPTQIRAGETLAFTKSLSDYPAPDWSITYTFRQLASSSVSFTFTSSASGSDHDISVPFNDTSSYLPGEYIGVGVVSDGTTKAAIWSGRLIVLPDLTADGDVRSQARKDLDTAIETRSKLLALLNTESTVEGSTFRKRELEDINKTIDRLTIIVRSENASLSGQTTRKNIRIRFT